MAFGVFPQKTEAEKFVRAHCLFITTYFLLAEKSLYCNTSESPYSRVILAGNGTTTEATWEDAAAKLRTHLAYLETLAATISEVDNSSLPSKEFLGAMLRKKYRKLGRGIRL